MNKVLCAPAFILHRQNYRETSLILDVFSRDYGRINLIAKGVRKNRRQQFSTFELYQRYLISWSARTELGTLTDIESDKQFISLNQHQLFIGFYMNELIIYLLHKHEPHAELFDYYSQALLALASGQNEKTFLRYFEKHLLESLGYGLVLDIDINTGEPIQEKSHYTYEVDSGPVLYNNNNENKLIISGKTLLQLKNESLSGEEQLREAKYLCRLIINCYLGNRKLKTRELYNAFINAGSSA